jgi:hypothetical protein
VLQTESAAVQSLTTKTQLETLPTSGRAYQTALALMPGVAQPNYDQSGGSNNPTRAMAITVNGQPPSNTVVRLDGVSQINQFFQQIQAYSPSLEAIETISVVTSSFDADQGMAGGASVNVQVKSGTKHRRRVGIRTRDGLPHEGSQLLPPARRSEGHGQRARVRRDGRRPYLQEQGVLLRERRTDTAAHRGRQRLSNSNANGLRSLPTLAMRQGNFAGTGTVLYDPRTGAANGTGPRAVRLRELSPGSRRRAIRGSTRATTSPPTVSIQFHGIFSASSWRRHCLDSRTTTSRPTATTPTTTSTTAR